MCRMATKATKDATPATPTLSLGIERPVGPASKGESQPPKFVSLSSSDESDNDDAPPQKGQKRELENSYDFAVRQHAEERGRWVQSPIPADFAKKIVRNVKRTDETGKIIYDSDWNVVAVVCDRCKCTVTNASDVEAMSGDILCGLKNVQCPESCSKHFRYTESDSPCILDADRAHIATGNSSSDEY